MTQQTLDEQQYRDAVKRKLCKEHNVTLIEIKQIERLTEKNIKFAVDKAISNIITSI